MSRSPPASDTARASDAYVAGWQATLHLLREGKSWSGSERNRAFLNCRRGSGAGKAPSPSRFANISAVTGLDAPDDGRGLAVVDWDGDGDLDLWFTNRTSPRLRLMLNQGGGNSFVTFRLRGTTSNRDGVGGRVEVELGGRKQARLVQTLYAGDAFLSQSSKWLHFGLGFDPSIEGVTVRWPGGTVETFSGVEPRQRYLLIEGRGEALAAPSARGRVAFEPQGLEAPAMPQPADGSLPASTKRIFLPEQVPMPSLSFARFGSPTTTEINGHSKPLLINLWASWCLPCIAELEQMSAKEAAIRSTGLEVLALSVDGLGEDQVTQAIDAQRLLQKLQFPFDAGLATRELLDKIEQMQDVLFDRKLPFAVPLSLLLDRSGQLAAIYRGRFETERLLRDVANLEASPEWRHAESAPLGGRWVARLPGVSRLALAKAFKSYPVDMEHFLELALAEQPVAISGPKVDESRRDLARQEATIRLGLAEAVHRQGRRQAAITHLERALELDSERGQTHVSLAGLHREAGRSQDALSHYRRAIALEPRHAEAHQGLGITLRSRGELELALQHLEVAAELRPEWAAPLIPIVWILVSTTDIDAGRAQRAERLAERALELAGGRHPVALDTLAAAYAAVGRGDDAIRIADEAIERARAAGNDALADQITERRRGYRP